MRGGGRKGIGVEQTGELAGVRGADLAHQETLNFLVSGLGMNAFDGLEMVDHPAIEGDRMAIEGEYETIIDGERRQAGDDFQFLAGLAFSLFPQKLETELVVAVKDRHQGHQHGRRNGFGIGVAQPDNFHHLVLAGDAKLIFIDKMVMDFLEGGVRLLDRPVFQTNTIEQGLEGVFIIGYGYLSLFLFQSFVELVDPFGIFFGIFHNRSCRFRPLWLGIFGIEGIIIIGIGQWVIPKFLRDLVDEMESLNGLFELDIFEKAKVGTKPCSQNLAKP